MRFALVLLTLLPVAACAPPPAPTVPVRTDSLGVEPELPSPGVPTSGMPDPDGEARLAEARQQWAAQRPDAYRFTYTRNCFCPPQYRGPFAATVRGDEAVNVAYEGEGEAAADALARADLTVDDLFDVLAEAYARNAASVTVDYAAETGQPTNVYIDYNEQIADEEVGFTIEPVRPLDG